jgi:hypothetical protein
VANAAKNLIRSPLKEFARIAKTSLPRRNAPNAELHGQFKNGLLLRPAIIKRARRQKVNLGLGQDL